MRLRAQPLRQRLLDRRHGTTSEGRAAVIKNWRLLWSCDPSANDAYDDMARAVGPSIWYCTGLLSTRLPWLFRAHHLGLTWRRWVDLEGNIANTWDLRFLPRRNELHDRMEGWRVLLALRCLLHFRCPCIPAVSRNRVLLLKIKLFCLLHGAFYFFIRGSLRSKLFKNHMDAGLDMSKAYIPEIQGHGQWHARTRPVPRP